MGVELRGEDMYNFLAKVVEVVMPRIKDYKGVSGSSGDSSGDIGWGFGPEVVGGFPEVEVNYDASVEFFFILGFDESGDGCVGVRVLMNEERFMAC